MYLSMDLLLLVVIINIVNIILSTYKQNWHDYNAFQLPNSTAQCNKLACQIIIKIASADSSCSVVWWGARAAYAEVSTGSV
jgi:hypothetical protein